MDNSFWVNYGEYIVGIPAIIISTVVAVWIYLKQIQKRKFIYKILSYDRRIYNYKLQNEIEEYKKENNLQYASAIIVKIENKGDHAIRKSHFERNIIVSFSKKTKILFVEIIKKEPIDINIEFSIKENELEIFPFLFNPRDKFYLKILIDSIYESPVFSSRIIGLTIKEKKDKYTFLLFAIYGMFLSFLLIFCVKSFILFNETEWKSSALIIIYCFKFLFLSLAILCSLILFRMVKFILKQLLYS